MINTLLFWLFPPTCLLCGAAGDDRQDLCAGCRDDLPFNPHACACCALPLATDEALICGQCQQNPKAFDRTTAVFRYQPPADFLIKGLKFHSRLPAGRLLGELLGETLAQRSDPLPECLIPVPLHRSRLRERGFNQALEIARPVARRLGIPLLPNGLRRIRHTFPQIELDGKRRLTNVRGAFVVDRPIQARHVALLDDVVTTGSTVEECAKALRRAGVETVEVWACARTVSG
jgi:ComF family protein